MDIGCLLSKYLNRGFLGCVSIYLASKRCQTVFHSGYAILHSQQPSWLQLLHIFAKVRVCLFDAIHYKIVYWYLIAILLGGNSLKTSDFEQLLIHFVGIHISSSIKYVQHFSPIFKLFHYWVVRILFVFLMWVLSQIYILWIISFLASLL